MIGGSTVSPDDDPLGPVVESFLTRFRRGERPALTELIARHPELAGRIQELIPALVELEQLGRSTGDSILSSGHRTGSRASWDEGPSPERLGDYLILGRIGGGGMGVVYEAVRESLKSRVALKVMHPRFRADQDYSRRFHAEARLAAALHHTNIVGVFDYGEQDGVCYYAMQFIQGQPLDHVLADLRRLRDDGTRADGLLGSSTILTTSVAGATRAPSVAIRGLLTGRFAAATVTGDAAEATDPIGACNPESAGSHGAVAGAPGPTEPSTFESSSLGGSGELRYFREIARVGAQVADALEYAHRRGVLHRDVKPSNLLLDAMGNVWVTDFGLAKLEEGEDLSQSHELVGTLRYMAPERFRRMSDRRGDIYSLGATLYELLTLRPAFEDSDQIRLMEQIRNDAPVPPRQIDRHIPRDLETIVLKALAKDPKDRFGTAGELADELRRFVEGRPIRSRPVSVVERFWRWCKRDPWLAGANVAAALLTTVLAVVAIVYRNQAEALRVERGRSEGAMVDAQWRAVDAYTEQARASRLSRQPGQRFKSLEAVRQAAKLLDGLPPGLDTVSRRETLRDLAIAALALPDLQPTGRVIPRPPGVIRFAFDPTMTRYALRFREGTISVRRVVDDRELARFPAVGDRSIAVFAFSPDGRYLASSDYPSGNLTVWDVDRTVAVVRVSKPINANAARFSPDSQLIAVGHKYGGLITYDLATRRRSQGVQASPAHLAFSPDGSRIAVMDDTARPPACRIYEAKNLGIVDAFPVRTPAPDVVWSPDGTTIASLGNDRKIDLFDVATRVLRATLEGHTNVGIAAAFHPSCALLASNDGSGQLRLWDSVLGRPLLNVSQFAGSEFSRDGRLVRSLEDQLIPYEVNPAPEYWTFAHVSREPCSYARPSVRHDGRVLAVGTDRGVVLWDLAHGTELAFLPIETTWHLMFEPSGELITSGSMGVLRWPIHLNPEPGESRIGPPKSLPLPVGNCGIAEDRSGRILAKADHDVAVVAMDQQRIRIRPLDDCRDLSISPDGQWLATGTHSESRGAQVWRIADGTKTYDLPINNGTHIEFSPDGKWLMTGAAPCRLWEVGTWREVLRIGDEALCFSPDGRLLVVQETSKMIRLVETATGRTRARLESPDLCAVAGATFSPDGSRLVVTTNDGPAVHVWDLRAIRKHLAGLGLDWDAPAYSDEDPADASAPVLARVQINNLHHPNESFEQLRAKVAVLAGEGRWEEAAAEFAGFPNPGAAQYAFLWFENAVLRLAVGDAQGYRATCRHILDVLRDDDAGDWLVYGAHTCALAADEPAEIARAVRLAERRYSLWQDEWTEHVVGLALYRAGRWTEAEALLVRSALRFDHPVLDWLVLSMVEKRLGRPVEARRWLERAENWVAIRLHNRPGGADRAVPEGWNWRDGVLLHLLLREARALIGAELPMLSEDVFAPAT